MAKLKDDNYIVIQAWMATDLNLKGNELLAYALIFGFSQDGESKYTGSLDYICKWLNCARHTAISALKGLVDKGLIEKHQKDINGVTFNEYRASRGSANSDMGSANSAPGVVQFLHGGSANSAPNNIDINYLYNNPPISPQGDDRFAKLWDIYPKHTGKTKAKERFNKLKLTEEEFNHILYAVGELAKTDQWQKEGGMFIPMLMTFINQRRWEDIPPRPKPVEFSVEQKTDDLLDLLSGAGRVCFVKE